MTKRELSEVRREAARKNMKRRWRLYRQGKGPKPGVKANVELTDRQAKAMSDKVEAQANGKRYGEGDYFKGLLQNERAVLTSDRAMINCRLKKIQELLDMYA